jgi:hypothetical protein
MSRAGHTAGFLELERFIAGHQACGKLTIDAPACDCATGFPISLVCECGDVLARWITVDAAFQDVIDLPWPSTAN